MVDGGSNGNDTQGYLKVLTLGSVHAKFQLGITIKQPHYNESQNSIDMMRKTQLI